MNRAARLAATIAVGALPVTFAAEAAAVAPPAVDDALLPRAAPPAPPGATEQVGVCFSALKDRAVTRAGEQLAGFDLPTVWRLARGAGQTVAVIDTGVAPHVMLPRLLAGGDYVSSGDGTADCDGHGTIVAGIIAASADSAAGSFTGIAPAATLLAIRQSSNKFRPVGAASGSGYGDVETLAMAIRTAADLGASVINVSSVACVAVDAAPDDRALGAALRYAVDVKNTVVVAAAGNVGARGQCPQQNSTLPGTPDWSDVRSVVSPAWYDDYVVTVGSVGPTGAPSPFTLAGPWVDVAAPGEGVVSLDPGGEGLVDALATTGADVAPIAGTSYAAPVVSGLAALIRSRWPQLTARQVVRRIEQTAQHPAAGWDPLVGHGVVDPLAAISAGTAPAAPEALAEQLPATIGKEPQIRSGRTAFAGAALCVAVMTGIALSTARRSARRLPSAPGAGTGD